MKKYITPSIEVKKFDVEDIITVSGDLTAKTVETTSDLYTDFKAGAGAGTADATLGFEW